MQIAVKQALLELDAELNHIKQEVQLRAEETANRTLEKLQEMSPDLADQLVPSFKSEPKFDSQFKLSIKSEDDISVNKRGERCKEANPAELLQGRSRKKTVAER